MQIVLKLLYSGNLTDKEPIINNLKKILNKINYTLSIRKVDNYFISVLITFNQNIKQ